MINKIINRITSGEPWTLITHDNCMDGTATAMLANHLVSVCKNNNIPMELYQVIYDQYKAIQELPELYTKLVLIVDFSYPAELIEAKDNDIYVIDHHTSNVVKELQNKDYALIDPNRSGAKIFLETIYQPIINTIGDDDIPRYLNKVIEYIHQGDTWTFEDDNAIKFAKGIASYKNNFIGLLEVCSNANEFNKIMNYGEAYLMLINKKARSVVINAHKNMYKWLNIKVPLINITQFGSEILNQLAIRHPFAIGYFITDKEIVFQFRAVKRDDVNIEALEYYDFVWNRNTDLNKIGAKGHNLAAGYSVPLENINLNFLSSKNIEITNYINIDMYTKPLEGIK